MPSARRHLPRLAVLAACVSFLVDASAGCSTTQEKAATQQARAKHILDARDKRQRKTHADGPKTSQSQTDSAHRPQEGEE